MRQKKRKTMEKETLHQRRHDSLHMCESKMQFWQKDTLVKPSKSTNWSVSSLKLELSKEKLKWSQFLFCLLCLIFLAYREQSLLIVYCPFFALDSVIHNSTGYVIKQLVHAFSCALSSYGALGKFREHSRSYSCPWLSPRATLTLSCSPNFPSGP